MSKTGGKRPGAGRRSKKNENRAMYLGNMCINKAIKIMERAVLKEKLNQQEYDIMIKVIPRMFPTKMEHTGEIKGGRELNITLIVPKTRSIKAGDIPQRLSV